jgi:hypothetical protein
VGHVDLATTLVVYGHAVFAVSVVCVGCDAVEYVLGRVLLAQHTINVIPPAPLVEGRRREREREREREMSSHTSKTK